MKTKITTFIFTFFAILTGIAQTTFTEGELNYEVISTAPALAKVTGTDIPLGTPLNINIPTTASDGTTQFEIVSVGNGAFKDATIVTLSLPNTIITIEQEAFENSGLTTVTIPNSVTTIERDAFRQNSITLLDLGEGVTTLGNGAFNINQLVSITLPASISTIEDGVFRNNSLETITVDGNTPPTTNNNGSNENSFGDRSDIVVTVPIAAENDYLNSPDWEDFFSINGQYTGALVGEDAEFTVGGFEYRVIEGGVPNTAEVIDTNLSGDIVIPAEFTVNTISFVVTGINNFGLNSKTLTSVILPNTITIIELGAFENNDLTSVTIPESVTTIEDRAFNQNTSLETVTIASTQPPTTDTDSFGTRTNINVTVPPAAVNTYLADANWEDFYSINGQYTGPLEEQFTTGGFTYEITAGGVPNTVKVFSTTLSGAIEIPAQVLNNTITFVPTAIEKFGLNNIDGGLTSVILPNTITIIEEGAFEDNQLTSVTIPESVTTIEDRAFNQNTSLETVIVAATQPPTTAAESFGTRTNINVTVPPAALQDYLDDANWEDFFSINGQYTGVVPFDFDKDGFSFRIFDASQPNNVLITGNTNSGTIIIPETVVENTLTFVPTRIGDNAFFDDGVTAVTLPNTITRIDNNAFANNALTTVTIPNTITRISDNAFASNALTTVNIPSNVRFIGPNAFANNSLTSLDIEERSNDVNLFIDANAFMNNQLTDITFPEFPAGVVINLKDDVFVNNSLETVRVEANNSNQVSFNNSNPFGDRSNINLLVPEEALNAYLNDVDWDGFFSTNEQYTGPIPFDFEQDGITYTITSAGDTNTVSATDTTLDGVALTIPDVLTERTIDFVPTVIGDFSFNSISLISVSLPNTITTIEEGAFEDNPLTTVTIPESVTAIEARAFNQNTSLETVTVAATQPPTTAADSFGTRTNINVTVPVAALDTYLNDTNWEDFFSINGQYTGALGEDGEFTVDGIKYRVTEGGSPNTVTVVDTNLSGALTIPEVVTENTIDFVPTIIFRFSLNNKGLTAVSIPNTIITIEEGAFEDNGNLTTITIPNSVTTIEGRAFRNNGLTTLNLGEGVETLGQGAFQNNPLTTVTIPDSVTLIESDAFRSNNLTTVDLGEGVVELGTAAFFSNELTDITIPASLTTLADNVFTSNQLETITVAANQPPTVTSSSFGTRTDIAVTVLDAALDTYLNDTNWEDFFSINGQYTGAIPREFTVDGIKYRITAGGVLNTVAVVSTTNSGIIIIPESVTENTVAFEPTTIIDLALNGQSINSLSLPNTIVSIGERAFQDNDLTTVTIPDSVTEIGDNAFENNELQTLVLGANLETLGDGAFNFNQLTAITLPAGITAIGTGTFRNNPLETITVLGSVPPTTNNNGATENSFGDRSDIVVTVPTAAENDYLNSEFWTGFFSINGQYTGPLEEQFTTGGFTYEITAGGVPNTVKVFSTALSGAIEIPEQVVNNTITFVPTAIEKFGLNNIDGGLTSVILPNTITIIEEGAFEDNQLTSVTIPESVTTIEARAFDINPLQTITVAATQPPSIASSSFGTRTNINVTVPPAAVDTYLADANWENFYSINGQYTGALGEEFTTGGFTYEITAGGVPNTVKVFSTTLSGAIEIPEQVVNNTITFIPTAIEEFGLNGIPGLTSVILPNTIITIGRGAFEDNVNLTTITIPNSVTTIEERAFQNNTSLTTVTIPDSVIEIGRDAFRNNGLTSVDLGEGLETLGQNSFFNNPLTTVTIPDSVTEIGMNAFRDNGLTTVNLGEGIEILREGAFFNNQLTDIIIPAGVTTIETSAFRNNPLTSVTVLATVPPTTDSSSSENSFGDRSGIDLFVPEGTLANYVLSGQWDGFNSINGVINIDITLALKVFLQGATINPNAGEEDLMRDDLRVAGLIPTTSPYSDGLTLDATVFDITGNNGIVDWVFVQLRDPNDASIVIEEKSALLQRDGDIVNTSGSSSLSFTLDEDDYFVSIEHRNHLGILSANAITLSAAPAVIDFTADLSVTQGGINALVEISEGKFAMVAGDFDENGQVQPTDVSDTTSAIGTSAYSNADMDMNGQIQPADINNLVNPNVGRGEQLLARSTLATSTGKGTHKHIEFRYAPKAQAANKQPSEGIHVKF